jgi:hypothetical protein
LCPVSLRIPSSSQSPDHDPHRTIYYLGYPLGRFPGLKHRQLARQVRVIITIGRIRRTLINKINLLFDSLRSIEASCLALVKVESTFLRCASGCFNYTARPGASACRAARQAARRVARRRLLHLRRASGCFGTSCGLSRDSSSTTSPRTGSLSTTSPTSRVRVPQHIARLVVDYFDYAAHPGASARRAARHAARHQLLRLRRASWCLSTSRRLVIDYFTYTARPVASARHAACCVIHHRLLRLS